MNKEDTDEKSNSDDLEDGEIREKNDTPSNAGGEDGEVFYDKKKSFFDSISCEALERSKGKMQRPDWKAEKKLNKETFGVPGYSGGGNWRGRGYGGGRGGRGYGYGGGRGGQGYRNQGE